MSVGDQKIFITVLFWFVLLSTFCMISLVDNIHKYISNDQDIGVYYDNDLNINHTIQFSNHQPHNITTNLKCDPPSVIHIHGGMKQKLLERGFNIQCTKQETRRIRQQFGNRLQYKGWLPKTCFHYNNLLYNKSFCNGGTLVYFDKQWMSIWEDILTKTSLHRVLNTYCNKYHSNDNVCDFNPISYDISIPQERNEFITKHIDCNNNQPQYNKTWVFKEDIEWGDGIHLINNHSLIYQLITADISENINNCVYKPISNRSYFEKEKFVYYHQTVDKLGYVVNRKNCLIQEFIANPLLIELQSNETIKHVFHLRSYFMIASYSNPFIVLNFPKFIFLINKNEYKNKEVKLDKKAIATNRHISEPDTVDQGIYDINYLWSNTEFQNYLDETYGEELLGGNYTMNKLNNDVKHILKHVFNANFYNNKLKKGKVFDIGKNYHFDMGCVDIIITDTFELKLLEINSYCGEMCYDYLRKDKKAAGIYDWDIDCYNRYNESSHIALEIFKKKYYNQKIRKIDALKHYEIVFWE